MGDEAPKKRHKEHRERKEHKRRRSRSRSRSPPETAADELRRLQEACEQLRSILRAFPAVRKELRALLWSVDNGQAVSLDGLADTGLKTALQSLFLQLRLVCTGSGLHLARAGAPPILRTVGAVFDERPVAVPPPSAAAQPRRAAPLGPPRPPAPQEVYRGPAPEDAPPHSPRRPEEPPLPLETGGPIGPSAAPPPRRLLGPAAPPRELLAALASSAVGPPPAEAVAEADLASAEDRESCAARLLRLSDARPPADAFDLLGLSESASAADVRRAFWRLSLLVHPDKCSHARAADAFAALSAAKEALADEQRRAALGEARREAALRTQFAQQMQADTQAARWRAARGLPPLEGDAALLQTGTAEGGREEWMTQMPAARRPPPAGAPAASVTAFSRRGVESSDAGGWAETPGSRAARNAAPALGGLQAFALDAAEATATLVDGYNAQQRPKSLVEQHRERAAAAAAAKPGAAPRRPFDRDLDLAVPKKPAQLPGSLGSMFAAGKGRTFL